MKIYYYHYLTTVGDITIVSSEEAITNIFFGKIDMNFVKVETDLIKRTISELNEYFEGCREDFDVPIDPKGTDFQKKVWQRLCKIPYGHTASYSQIAFEIGNPKACRAVGGANGRNPIPIIIPCHRVISKNGKIGGFSADINIKLKLLRLENETAPIPD